MSTPDDLALLLDQLLGDPERDTETRNFLAREMANAILDRYLVVPRADMAEEWALHDTAGDPDCSPDGDLFESLADAKRELEKQRGAWRSGGSPVYYRVISRWRTRWRPVEPAVNNLPLSENGDSRG